LDPETRACTFPAGGGIQYGYFGAVEGEALRWASSFTQLYTVPVYCIERFGRSPNSTTAAASAPSSMGRNERGARQCADRVEERLAEKLYPTLPAHVRGDGAT
jgi:hypothetical protein